MFTFAFCISKCLTDRHAGPSCLGAVVIASGALGGLRGRCPHALRAVYVVPGEGRRRSAYRVWAARLLRQWTQRLRPTSRAGSGYLLSSLWAPGRPYTALLASAS